jgi:K+-sensing histidine kinase KdpD
LVGLLVAAAVPFVVAIGLLPIRSSVPNATLALLLALVVSVLAATGTRLAAGVAAIAAALSFDATFTRPYSSLSMSRSQDVETTVLLLAVALVVGQVAARNRRHRRLVAEKSYDLGRVHAVAEMVASGAPAEQVVLAVANELKDMLGLRSCWFEPSFAEKPGPFIEREGTVSWGALRWGCTTLGLPAEEITLVVEHQCRPLGRYVLLAPPGTRVTEDALLAAVALADQAGAARAVQAQSA